MFKKIIDADIKDATTDNYKMEKYVDYKMYWIFFKNTKAFLVIKHTKTGQDRTDFGQKL